MKDWPYGVTGTRNEHLLAALKVVEQERDVRDHERHAFREGFIAGWQERGIDEHRRDIVSITREELARLQRKAGEVPDGVPVTDERMNLGQALFQRDGYQQAYERVRAELDAARARIAELETFVNAVHKEVEHADRAGAWTLDVGPVQEALTALASATSEGS